MYIFEDLFDTYINIILNLMSLQKNNVKDIKKSLYMLTVYTI